MSDTLGHRGLYSTGMGSWFLLQGIFPTQELNQGLLYYRWILYQLSYQGSPQKTKDQQKILNEARGKG